MKNLYLSLTTLLILPLISFAQNGQSCNQAYNYNIESEEDYYFVESQKWIYIDFTADDDSLELFILQGNNSETTFDLIEIFEKSNCNNLTLVYSDTGSLDLPVVYAKLYSLNVGSHYMFTGRKIGPFEESEMKFRINKTLITPCNEPPLNCHKAIRNGDFSYTSVANPIFRNGNNTAFTQNQVCDWLSLATTPDLVYLDGPNHNGLPLSNPYVYMGASCPPNFTSVVEAIGSEVNFIPEKSYELTFKLRIDPYRTVLPTAFKVWLVKQSDLDNLVTPGTDIPNMSNYEEVASVQGTSLNSFFTLNRFCFTVPAGTSYDRIIFFPLVTCPGGITSSAINLDDIDLIAYDAGGNKDITNICSGNVEIGSDCSIPNASYSWSPAVGLSSTTAQNPIANPSVTTTYTVTVTQANGCTLTDQVTVNVNASPIDYTTFNGELISDVKNSLGVGPGQNISNKIFHVNGTLEIDEITGFYNCSFYFEENAKINSNGHQLWIMSFNNSTPIFLKSCNENEYWDGIYVNDVPFNQFSGLQTVNGGYAILEPFSTIENSTNGIVLKDVQNNNVIRGFKFINNVRSITIENTAARELSVDVFQNSFVSTEPNVATGTYPNNSILLKNLSIITTGASNYIESAIIRDNEFMANGGKLRIIDSDGVRIEGNYFKDFNNQFVFPGFPNVEDLAISIKGSSREPKIQIRSNHFLNNARNIQLSGKSDISIVDNLVNIDVNNNNLFYTGIPGSTFLTIANASNLNGSTGYSSPSNTSLNYISNNKIYNVEKGVELYDSPFFHIYNNHFDMEVQPAEIYTDPAVAPVSYQYQNNENSVAIYSNSYNKPSYIIGSGPSMTNLVIDQNTISHSKVGIQTEFTYADIAQNKIFDLNNNINQQQLCFPQPPQGCPLNAAYGIRIMNHGTYTRENEIIINNSNYTVHGHSLPRDEVDANGTPTVTGISTENSTFLVSLGPSVSCNKIENTGIGLKFNGYNNQADVLANRLVSNDIGLALANEAYVGDFGYRLISPGIYNNTDAANIFTSSISRDTYNYSNSDPLNPPKYYFKGAGPIITPFDATAGYLSIEDILTSNSNSISCTAPLLVHNDDGKGENTYYRSKSGRGNQRLNWNRKGNGSDSALSLRQQLQFYHLSKDSSLYNNSQFRTFRDSMKNTVLGRAFKLISRAINANSLTNFDQQLIIVEPIINKHFADSSLNQADLNRLRSIANLCPYTNGIAVYQARRVLREYGDELLVNNCELSNTIQNQVKKRRLKSADTSNFALKIFPNPANQRVNLYLETSKESTYSTELVDLIGKRIQEQAVVPYTNNTFDVSEMQSGVYFIRLFEDGALIQTQKLVVQ